MKKKETNIIFSISKNTKQYTPPHIWIIIETNMIRFFKKVTYFQYFPIFYCTA